MFTFARPLPLFFFFFFCFDFDFATNFVYLGLLTILFQIKSIRWKFNFLVTWSALCCSQIALSQSFLLEVSVNQFRPKTNQTLPFCLTCFLMKKLLPLFYSITSQVTLVEMSFFFAFKKKRKKSSHALKLLFECSSSLFGLKQTSKQAKERLNVLTEHAFNLFDQKSK